MTIKQFDDRPIVALIDDDHTFHVMTKIAVRETGRALKFIPFFDGREALQFLYDPSKNKGELPDIILLDLNMPEYDGWAFLDEFELIRDTLLKKNIAIYVVSSSIDQQDIERAKKHFTVADFVTKPLTIDMLNSLLSVSHKAFNLKRV